MNEFKIDEITFIQDFRAGNIRGQSEKNRFVLVKTNELLDKYKTLQCKKILEIGMFEGGSMVYLDKTLKPIKLVGVDIRNKILPLEEYIKDKPYIKTFYNVSQDSKELDDILAKEFSSDIDLIIDDASHLYTLSKKTLENCWKHLQIGGKYIIEDWQWSLRNNYQNKENAWHDQPALANLVIEIVLNSVNQKTIELIEVYRDMIIITKGTQELLDVDSYKNFLRNRELGLL